MKPFMMYLIGISGSGKTTIASKVTEELNRRGVGKLQFIDGDVIRSELKGLFGYTFEERMKNNRVVCVVADYLIRNGISVILAQVAGHQNMRDQVRGHFPENYIEVYVKCSVEECTRRDVKGYYNKVKDGKMENLNGVNAEFDEPHNSDIVINTEELTEEEATRVVIDYLEKNNWIEKK